MKVRITKMPVRINNKRYAIGDELTVDENLYKSIKSIAIIVDEDKTKKKVKKQNTKKTKPKKKSKPKKEDLMIKLAERGIEFNPNSTVDELLELLG